MTDVCRFRVIFAILRAQSTTTFITDNAIYRPYLRVSGEDGVEQMAIMTMMDFLTVAVIAFAIVMILAGLFVAYFGTGKSRSVGCILLIVGILVGGIWAYLCGYSDIETFKKVAMWDVFLRALVNLIGVLVGALIAVGIFLVAVMKS